MCMCRMCFVCVREAICVDGAGGSVYMCGCESTKKCVRE